MKKALRFALTAAVTTMLMATMALADYKDVPADSPLADEVQKATEYGLMNGYNESKVGYLDSMTRAQFTAGCLLAIHGLMKLRRPRRMMLREPG